jgi:hypothetical protein
MNSTAEKSGQHTALFTKRENIQLDAYTQQKKAGKISNQIDCS